MNKKDIKHIPYGISDFDLFRKGNYYFIDKTPFIRNIEEKGNFLFLIRPRRFGKSLFLGVIEAYYDIYQKDRFDYLFDGTYIHKNPTTEKNNFMVLKLNFSEVDADVSMVKESFLLYIKESVYGFVLKYEKYLDIDPKEAKIEINQRNSASDVLRKLISYCTGKRNKLYIIIDEYDNFANTIISEVGDQEFQKITHGQGFLRSFFNVIKAGTTGSDSPISRLFMTGVSPITLDDVTSGFNIASNISLHNDLNEIVGFTRDEIEEMVDYYRQTGKISHSTPILLDIMSRWYNHYRFSLYATKEVFNSVHVLYFLQEYMLNSRIPTEMIDRNVMIDYNKLRHLIIIDKKGSSHTNGNFSRLRQIIENGFIHSHIIKGFPITKLIAPENFTSLLYYFGLLTIDGIDETNEAILKIPNESIKRLFYDYIKETYEETGIFSLNFSSYDPFIKEMAFNGQWRPLIEFLANRIDDSLGLRDLITGEKSIQAMLNVYLGLSDLFFVSSEKELNKGFADLVLEPFLSQYPSIKYSYIIEIKYIKPSDYANVKAGEKLVQHMIEEAKTQLKQYGEDQLFLNSIGSTTLIKLILIFSGTKLIHYSECN